MKARAGTGPCGPDSFTYPESQYREVWGAGLAHMGSRVHSRTMAATGQGRTASGEMWRPVHARQDLLGPVGNTFRPPTETAEHGSWQWAFGPFLIPGSL